MAAASDAPNYITPEGLASLKVRYAALLSEERPKLVETVSWAAGNGDRSENGDYIYGKKRLREIDRELGWLSRQIRAAKVVNPAAQTDLTRVWFGATVTIVDQDDRRRILTIVGDDEADASASRIGWNSPFGCALRGAGIGDTRWVKLPAGERALEVIAISYPTLSICSIGTRLVA